MRPILWLILTLITVPACASPVADWLELEPGLALSRFDSQTRQPAADGDLVVLLAEPGLWRLRLLRKESLSDERSRNLQDWCREFDLTLAVNAGMYQADGSTHVGFCQDSGQVVNPHANDYLSACAFDPHDPADPPFRIFDLDETPLAEISARYETVIQNLRLIKRNRENRWQPSTERWREAALAEDSGGNILLVFCATPWSMSDFNEILLHLPLDLVCAQHLEGGYPARLRVEHEALVGAADLGSGGAGPPLPNVLSLVRRTEGVRLQE